MFAEACQALDDMQAETTLPPDFKIILQRQTYCLSGGFRAESGAVVYRWHAQCFECGAPFAVVKSSAFDTSHLSRRCPACAQPGKPVIGVKARRKPASPGPS